MYYVSKTLRNLSKPKVYNLYSVNTAGAVLTDLGI